MNQIIQKASQLIESFCNFFSAIMILFMALLLISPLLNQLDGHKGIGWIALTIISMVTLYIVVSVGADPFFHALDKIRKGEILAWLFSPLRNIAAVIGLYSVLKTEYFLIHSEAAPEPGPWGELIWEFFIKF